ncbi:MAG: hypothetical protein MJZ64_06775 [Paludibacteraceae bacterium]|nr:hypothetical protein [Paludibacteraceae bacterium]
MARIKYNFLIDSVSGKFCRKEHNGTIQRQKHFRDENGNIIGEGVNESFSYLNPRDYRKNPPHGEEARNVSVFGQAVKLAKVERANPERLAYWTNRWHRQLKKGESDAPLNPETGQPRIYRRLDLFIQTVIQRELKAGTWNTTPPSEL